MENLSSGSSLTVRSRTTASATSRRSNLEVIVMIVILLGDKRLLNLIVMIVILLGEKRFLLNVNCPLG